MNQNPKEVLWNYALRALTRRAHTTQELKTKLERHWAYDEAVAEATLQRLKENRYLDDDDFIKRTIEQSARLKPMGLRGLQARLARKGIAQAQVKEAFHHAGIDEAKLAEQALNSSSRKWERVPPEKIRQKQLMFLASRGFTASVALRALASFRTNAQLKQESIVK